MEAANKTGVNLELDKSKNIFVSTLNDMGRLLFIWIVLFAVSMPLSAQVQVSGRVVSDKGGVPYASVVFSAIEHKVAAAAGEDGAFVVTLPQEGAYLLEAFAVGFQRKALDVDVSAKQTELAPVRLELDLLELDQVVVTGSRSPVASYLSPVIVNRIDERIFESTQALSLSEGLSFSPGLRVENNCQNCGFTQLRMNGLEGAYSQVLINSRPVFSALAGVYGLEMIPPNMIDRVEVVKGGGSVLYGGNAIGGTVNIITKDPLENTFEAGINQSMINGEASDRAFNFNGTLVSDDLKQGISLYGFARNRDHWDANGDGFSEVTLLENTTFGLNAYWHPDDRNKLRLDVHHIAEFRRGGNDFDLAPHQAAVAEQLDHRITHAGLSYEWFSRDYRHKVSAYGSAQFTTRRSYYGGGGRVLTAADSLTAEDLLAINAYGNSEDLAAVSGLQYAFTLNEELLITAGSEWQHNNVTDAMPGYERTIEQTVNAIGNYMQVQWEPLKNLSIVGGVRHDRVHISGLYDYSEESFSLRRNLPVVVPRLSLMYELNGYLKVRGSYAQGYRAPQAFDEDLHIETVGGAARFVRLDPELQTETSDSFTASLNYARRDGDLQGNMVLEGFMTMLNNPFVLSDQTELASGVAVITKRNGSGARVQGLNLEGQVAYTSKWTFRFGATLQSARFNEPEVLWEPDMPNEDLPQTQTSQLLRTPETYGFATVQYQPVKGVTLDYSGVYTGSMHVAHVIDPNTEYTVVKRTPSFFEHNGKVNYVLTPKDAYTLTLFVGVQNIGNSFQDDFDQGADRDSGYVYGPIRPRTFFGGLKVSFR